MSKKNLNVSDPGSLSQADLRYAFDRGLITKEAFEEYYEKPEPAVAESVPTENVRADVLESAEREASVILGAANQEAERIVDAANAEADGIIQEAKREAEAILEDAKKAIESGAEKVAYDLEVDLEKWTIPQLKQYLTDNEIEFKASATKPELIALAAAD